MAQFLLEFFSEEIPARMQARAEADLERLICGALQDAGVRWSGVRSFSGPRRLGLVIDGLPERTPDVSEERKGPRTDAPAAAIEGFLRGAGLASVDQCRVEETKKGTVYIAVIETPGRETLAVLAEAVEAAAKGFPWPKSMKFGEGEAIQRWVRPLQRVLALFGGAVVPARVFGIEASNITEGHRIHGSGPFAVSGFEDYAAGLAQAGVILMRAERRETILSQARRVCADAGLALVEDEGLLDEVTGLVEHPVAILGEMDPGFLDLPAEVIQLTMKTHQKYFAVRDAAGRIAPKFVVIANQAAPDGGKAIAAGNARVLSARLSDARHFWDLDRKRGLETLAQGLGKVTFHDKLGTVADKVERVAALARELAPALGADPDLAACAARLAKADLVSQMVYEFPELQGVMGRYYALDAGLDPVIADAIRDHYKPQGPSDGLPGHPVGAAVALADKLDTLVGFWAIDEKPTGSKDPFALRRAALGAIRVLVANGYRADLARWIMAAANGLGRSVDGADLLAFFADRLKVHLKEEGVRHDVIDAVFARGDDDLVRVTRKARALQGFIDTPDGVALLAGYRRAANILAAEEKKGFDLDAALDAALPAGIARGAGALSADARSALMIAIARTAEADAERVLIAALDGADEVASLALRNEDFEAAMAALSRLRGPVDAFFEAVVVNAENEIVRRNRLLLLSRIRAAVEAVADFSKLEG